MKTMSDEFTRKREEKLANRIRHAEWQQRRQRLQRFRLEGHPVKGRTARKPLRP